MAGAIVTNLVALVPVLGAACGVVFGAVVLVTGWKLLSERAPRQNLHRFRRRDAKVPPVVTGRADNGGDVR